MDWEAGEAIGGERGRRGRGRRRRRRGKGSARVGRLGLIRGACPAPHRSGRRGEEARRRTIPLGLLVEVVDVDRRARWDVPHAVRMRFGVLWTRRVRCLCARPWEKNEPDGRSAQCRCESRAAHIQTHRERSSGHHGSAGVPRGRRVRRIADRTATSRRREILLLRRRGDDDDVPRGSRRRLLPRRISRRANPSRRAASKRRAAVLRRRTTILARERLLRSPRQAHGRLAAGDGTPAATRRTRGRRRRAHASSATRARRWLPREGGCDARRG